MMQKTDQNNSDTSLALKNRKIVHISEVRSGLGCNCYCANPECGSRMIARKGKVRAHHFAHYEKANCGKSYESALHKLAKEILQEQKQLRLKAFYGEIDRFGEHELIPEQEYIAEKVLIEEKCGKFKVDLLLKNSTQKLIIEIYVTHKTEDEKISYFREKNYSALEVDLSGLIEKQYERDKIEEILLNDISIQNWLSVKDRDLLKMNKYEELLEQERQEEKRRIEKEESEKQARLNRENEIEQERLKNRIEYEKYQKQLEENKKPPTIRQKVKRTAVSIGVAAIIIKFRKQIYRLFR